MSIVRVTHIDRALSARFPLERAEDWDRCGLLAGDPDAVVTGVVVALDPTPAVIDRTAELGANVLVTHHPAFLTAPQWIAPGRGSAGVVFSAISQGVALIAAHTNLDRDAAAQGILPELLGYRPLKGLERSVMPMSVVTVFAPPAAAERVADAMAGAGAGRLGAYGRCSYTGEGTGRFTPDIGTVPHSGTPGSASQAAEVRVEMVAPSSRVRGVVSAAVAAHPYEEPLVTAHEAVVSRNAARLGMLCEVEPTSLGDLATRAGATCGVTPRVWGDPQATVTRVATATGSAGSLIGDAISAGAQTLVAGEVRYHDAVDAAAAGLAIIELGHDVTEWPLVALLERAVRDVAGLDADLVHVLPATAGWWTPEMK